MHINFSGEVVRVITEHTYVNGLDIRYFGDEELMNKIRIFHLNLEKLVGSFYGNHYVVEIKPYLGSSIYIGIHDAILIATLQGNNRNFRRRKSKRRTSKK